MTSADYINTASTYYNVLKNYHLYVQVTKNENDNNWTLKVIDISSNYNALFTRDGYASYDEAYVDAENHLQMCITSAVKEARRRALTK